MEFTNQFINREHHPVDVTLIYLSQKSFRQFQVPKVHTAHVSSGWRDDCYVWSIWKTWFQWPLDFTYSSSCHDYPSKKVWTCYILEMTPSTLTSMHKYMNAQVIAKKSIDPLHKGFWLSSTYFFPGPPKFPSRHLRLGAISDEEHEVVGPLRHIHVRLGSQGVKLRVLCSMKHGIQPAMGHGKSSNQTLGLKHYTSSHMGLSLKHWFEENILELKHVGFSTGQVGFHMVGDGIHLHQTCNPGKIEKFVAITLMWAKQKWQTIPTFTWFHHEWVI